MSVDDPTGKPTQVSDQMLISIARGFSPDLETAQLMADELVARRRWARRDSRRAEQVRRMRWTVESLLRKVEEIEKRDADEMKGGGSCD